MNLENLSSNPLKFLWQFYKKYKLKVFLIYLCFFIGNITFLYGTACLYEKIINNFSTGNLNLVKISWICFLILLCLTNYFLISIYQNYLYLKSFELAKKDIRNELFSYSLKHEIAYFNEKFSGDISNKINSIISNLENLYYYSLFIVNNIIAFLIALVIVGNISYFLVAFALLWFICFYISLKYFIKKNYEISQQVSEEEDKSSGIINDCFKNISLIKAFLNERQEYKLIRKQSVNILKNKSFGYMANSMVGFVSYFYSIIFIFGTISISYFFYKDNIISFGKFLFLAQVLYSLSSWIRWLVEFMISSIDILGGIKNSLGTLLEKVKVNNSKNAKKIEIEQGEIVIKNLSFSYIKDEVKNG